MPGSSLSGQTNSRSHNMTFPMICVQILRDDLACAHIKIAIANIVAM